MQVNFYDVVVDNLCEGAHTIVLTPVDDNESPIALPYNQPRQINFSCHSLAWENNVYYPVRTYSIHPGHVTFFNPCLNDSHVVLEIRPVKGGRRVTIRFVPEDDVRSEDDSADGGKE